MTFAASWSRWARACEYTRSVIDGSRWPSRPAIVTASLPEAIPWVAAKCRRA